MSRPVPPSRRGACPALTAPMATGDGLLVRLVPAEGALSCTALAGLADAAEAFGNGVLEVTARGSLQIRGLRAETVGPLNDAVARLGIAAREGLALDISPLAGLDAAEIADARPLAAAIRTLVAQAGLAERLGPKVSVVLDGGGAVSLDASKADIRLTVRHAGSQEDGRLWDVALAGDAATARPLCTVSEAEAPALVAALLARIATLGLAARMADVGFSDVFSALPWSAESTKPDQRRPKPVLRSVETPALSPGTARMGRATVDDGTPSAASSSRPERAPSPIATFPLLDGTLACGIGLPFGHVEAGVLKSLAAAAKDTGVRDLRPAPGRVLLATGLNAAGAAVIQAAAAALGFLTRPEDPRRFIAACAGAPACASGHLAARALAPEVAATLAPILDGSVDIHVSGCTKGCAHPARATLTLAGLRADAMDKSVALVREGTAGDAARPTLSVATLLPALARLAAMIAATRRPGESTAQALARLPAPALLETGLLETAVLELPR